MLDVLKELEEYCFLNGLKQTATAIIVTRAVADEDIGPQSEIQKSNIIEFPSLWKL